MNVTMTERPLALPAVWAPVSAVSMRSGQPAHELLVGDLAARDLLAAGAPQLPQVGQLARQAVPAPAQIEMAQLAANYGTTGFRGDIATAKQAIDVVSGAPPRGRPV